MKIERRDPNKVMRLSQLGSFHQCRLSFMRQLTRRMAAEEWRFETHSFEIDERGVGHAVLTAQTPERTYSLVAFAHDLPADQRSDRVIAEAWDATFTLFDGTPSDEDIKRLSQNVPLQEAGRVSEKELTLSRANRSVRLWEEVVNALSNGLQPDADRLIEVGYLMRTTAVYGSGKFGAADRQCIEDRAEFQSPFQVEMLTVFLIRSFVRHLINHLAKARNPNAAQLDPDLARLLGIGNSTGLGMAPFIINHPLLFNNWIMVREEALARVRAVEIATTEEIDLFLNLWNRCKNLVSNWRSDHPLQQSKLSDLATDIAAIDEWLQPVSLQRAYAWNSLIDFSETLSPEGHELLVSICLEPYGDLTDGLASCMADAAEKDFFIKGDVKIAGLIDQLETDFQWVLDVDWQDDQSTARAWYVSAEKLEPRLGERYEEPIADYEQPLSPARDLARAYQDMKDADASSVVADFLLAHPQHRSAIRRLQMAKAAPYSEIRDNTISAGLKPIDMLRAKLSFFGATRFDPRSDRWVRISMYAGAPYPEDLNKQNCDFWVYPEVPA